MLVVKVRPNAPVLILDVILEARALEHFFGHLELQCLKDRLILEESRKLYARHQLLHVYQGQAHKLEHLLQERVFFLILLEGPVHHLKVYLVLRLGSHRLSIDQRLSLDLFV